MNAAIPVPTWSDFKNRLEGYYQLAVGRRDQLIFRGQADAQWRLRPTLDRECKFKDSRERDECLSQLIKAFQWQSTGLAFSLGRPQSPNEWELLARHHGLPTTILDWTSSPYVAAFFAFFDPAASTSESVAIWMFDRAVFEGTPEGNEIIPGLSEKLEVFNDLECIHINPRAFQQRSVFMRLRDSVDSLENLLSKYLWRFEIPRSERMNALTDLDEMGINARSLFLDLDHAAQTAAWQVLSQQRGHADG